MDGLTRQRFDILTSSGGAFVDTGPPCSGAVVQVRYVPDGTSPLDTGADIDLVAISGGQVVASWDNIGAAAFTKVPKQPVHDTGGVAVSGLREFVFVGAPDQLRLSVAAGGNAKRGTLYVWTGW